MTPEELVLTIIDMHARRAPMATIFTVAARALAAERERCIDTLRDLARRHPETSDRAIVLRSAVAELERSD